jgi:hypothetical protein
LELSVVSPTYGHVRTLGSTATLVGLAVVAALGVVGLAAPAEATQFRVRSITIGKATQYVRSDRTVAAPRVFTQGLSLWGYDLRDDQSGSVNAHVSFRFHTDLALARAERDHPYLGHKWNELALDLAYLDWRPHQAMRLRLGRQWSQGPLGVRDFDGLAARWRPRLERDTHAHFEIYGGRDVQVAFGRFAPATFDVQGLPPDDTVEPDKLDGTHLIAGASTGLSWAHEASVRISWRRRFGVGVDTPDGSSQTVVGSERFGAAASASIRESLVTSAHGSYHSQLGDVDRAGAQISWSMPGPAGVATAGVDHRHPWFDSSSIFNLFGARPFQGGFAVYRHPLDALATEVEVRGWGRLYHGDDDATAPGVAARDERTVGGALSHRTRARLWDTPLDWRSLLSYQTSLDRGTEQLLADVNLRVPIIGRDLFLTGRGLFLAALTDNARLDNGQAATGVLGVDIPVFAHGTFSAAVETTASSFFPTNTSVYATFAVEHWP